MKEEKRVKKVSKKTFLIIVMIAMLATILLLMPDLLWFLRKQVVKIPILKFIVIGDIDRAQYLSMMLTIISCCISAVLSYTAYRLSKEIGELSKKTNAANLRFAAYSIREYIMDTSKIIRKAKKKIADLSDLKEKNKIINQWILLCLVVQFSDEEKDFLYKYNRKISQIIKYYKKQNSTEVEKMIDNFCNAYFDVDDEELGFNKKTSNIVSKIKNVWERGEL